MPPSFRVLLQFSEFEPRVLPSTVVEAAPLYYYAPQQQAPAIETGPYVADPDAPPAIDQTPASADDPNGGTDNESDKPVSTPGQVGRHGDLKAPNGFQSNHLNQDAVFKPDPANGENNKTDKCIGTNDGAAIIIEGDVSDKDSQHYRFHKSLDDWWQTYRDNNTKPTIGEYNKALEKALRAAGLTEEKIQEAMSAAKKNQKDHGFEDGDMVPRTPRSRNTPKDGVESVSETMA